MGLFHAHDHGISEKLMEDVMKTSHEFHNLPAEEKKGFSDKGPLAPIRHGTSFFPEAEKVHYWRDYLKDITQPEFNFPQKPPGFKDVAYDLSLKIRAVARTLLQGVWESLGLEPTALVEAIGLQIFAVNLYPPCPLPDLTLGMPPHTKDTRISLVVAYGPNMEEIGLAAELMEKEEALSVATSFIYGSAKNMAMADILQPKHVHLILPSSLLANSKFASFELWFPNDDVINEMITLFLPYQRESFTGVKKIFLNSRKRSMLRRGKVSLAPTRSPHYRHIYGDQQ